MYLPKYQITNTILKNVSLIEAAREVVENAALVPAWEAKFRRDAVIRTVHYGTHLEGNPLSKEQVERVVEEEELLPKAKGQGPRESDPVSPLALSPQPLSLHAEGVIAKERDIQEVLNYREVLKFIDAKGVPIETGYGRVKTDSFPYSLADLKEIHRLVSHKVLPAPEQGRIRQVQVIIRNKQNGEVIFRPPPPQAVPVQLDEFFAWINGNASISKDHPVVRAGIAHWELVRIHPFTDGNGRAARAMTLLVLFQEGYDVKRFFSIEQYYDQNPADYYTALQAASHHRDGEITDWLEYFTDGLAIELSRVKDRVLALSKDLKLKGKLGRQISLSERQIKIMEYMETNHGQITTYELTRVMRMVSRDTLLRDMNDLAKKGIIRKVGTTKSARYILNE